MSNEQKWTPGPWEIINDGDIFAPLGGDSGDGVRADSSDGWQIAEVDAYIAFVDGGLVELGAEPRRANARLIAAAPELFEALDGLLSELDSTPEIDLSSWGVSTAKARAALAKARGEQL